MFGLDNYFDSPATLSLGVLLKPIPYSCFLGLSFHRLSKRLLPTLRAGAFFVDVLGIQLAFRKVFWPSKPGQTSAPGFRFGSKNSWRFDLARWRPSARLLCLLEEGQVGGNPLCFLSHKPAGSPTFAGPNWMAPTSAATFSTVWGVKIWGRKVGCNCSRYDSRETGRETHWDKELTSFWFEV